MKKTFVILTFIFFYLFLAKSGIGMKHPRPDFYREHWFSLNGFWDFDFDMKNRGIKEGWFIPGKHSFTRKIKVPYPWESELSEIEDLNNIDLAWYSKEFVIPRKWQGSNILLKFGAVNYSCKIWLNGKLLGKHKGGQSPFEFLITSDELKDKNYLVLGVYNPLDLRTIPHGKQHSIPPDLYDNCCFTRSSGIWQEVWIEKVGNAYIKNIMVTPDIDNSLIKIELIIYSKKKISSNIKIDIKERDSNKLVKSMSKMIQLKPGTNYYKTTMKISKYKKWSLDNPFLYSLIVKIQNQDKVETYFGMRKFYYKNGRFYLNNKPLFLYMVLDQGYWIEGLYTPPSDADFKRDILLAKQMGFNGIRMHLKFENPRFLYWADKLGMLIWQEPPSFSVYSENAVSLLEDELEAIIKRDYNHPSVVIYSIFNEEWGLEFDVVRDKRKQNLLLRLYKKFKTMDPTRLWVDNSGWSHVKTDIVDFHYYANDFETWRNNIKRIITTPNPAIDNHILFASPSPDMYSVPFMNSEFYRKDYHAALNEFRKYEKLMGIVFCELYDVEYEKAGLLYYDRTPKDFDYSIKRLNTQNFIVIENKEINLEHPIRLTEKQEIELKLILNNFNLDSQSSYYLIWKTDKKIIGKEKVQIKGKPGVRQLYKIKINKNSLFPDKRLEILLLDSKHKEIAYNFIDFKFGQEK